MANKQDSYWMEYTLDEKVDQKVCEYLREHHAEYRNTKQKMKELMEQYPNVQAVFETGDAVTLTAEEHEILHTQTSHIKNGLRTLKNQYFNPQNSNHAALCPWTFDARHNKQHFIQSLSFINNLSILLIVSGTNVHQRNGHLIIYNGRRLPHRLPGSRTFRPFSRNPLRHRQPSD